MKNIEKIQREILSESNEIEYLVILLKRYNLYNIVFEFIKDEIIEKYFIIFQNSKLKKKKLKLFKKF